MAFPVMQQQMNPLLMQLLMSGGMGAQPSLYQAGGSSPVGPQIPQPQQHAAGVGAMPIMAQPPTPPPGLLSQMSGNGTGTGGGLGMSQGLLAPKPPTASVAPGSGATPAQASPQFPIPVTPQNPMANLGPMNFAQQPSNWMQRLFGSNFNGFNQGAQ